jgi:hypothetical protein
MQRKTTPPTREQLKQGIRQAISGIGPQVIRDARHHLNRMGRDMVVIREGFRATVDDADLVATQDLRQLLTEILGESFPPDA